MSEFSKGYEKRRRPVRTFYDPVFSSNYWIYGSILISWGIGLLPFNEWPFFPNLLVMTLVFGAFISLKKFTIGWHFLLDCWSIPILLLCLDRTLWPSA